MAQFRAAGVAGVNISTLNFSQDLVPVKSSVGYQAGILGELMFPGIGFGIDLGLRDLVKFESKTIEVRWAQDVKSSDGSTKTEGCKAFLRSVPKTIPGLSVDPGNPSENEITLAVSRYQLFVAGTEYWLIDQLNTILRVGGKDYAQTIRSVL